MKSENGNKYEFQKKEKEKVHMMKKKKKIVSMLASVLIFTSSLAVAAPGLALAAETGSTQENVELAPEYEPTEDTGTTEDFGNTEDTGSTEKAAENEDDDENNSETASTKDMEEDASLGETETSEQASSKEETEEATAASTEEATGETLLITEDTRLMFESQGFYAYTDVDESVMLPAGTTLRVKEIAAEEETDAFQAYSTKATETLSNRYEEQMELNFGRFYEISFVYEEEEVQPAANVKIHFGYNEPVETGSDAEINVVRFDEEGEAEILSCIVNDGNEEETLGTVEFETDRACVFGIVSRQAKKEETARTLKAEGDSYEITVTLAPETKLPEDAELAVSEIMEGTPEYDQYKALAEKSAAGSDPEQPPMKVEYARLFRIRIVSDGQEIAPDESMKVDIRLMDRDMEKEDISYKAVKIQNEKAQELDAEIGEGISFGTDGL